MTQRAGLGIPFVFDIPVILMKVRFYCIHCYQSYSPFFGSINSLEGYLITDEACMLGFLNFI